MIKKLLILRKDADVEKNVYGVSWDYKDLVEKLKKIKALDDANERNKQEIHNPSPRFGMKDNRQMTETGRTKSTLRVIEFVAAINEDKIVRNDNWFSGSQKSLRQTKSRFMRSKSILSLEKQIKANKSPLKMPPRENLPNRKTQDDIFRKTIFSKSCSKFNFTVN